MCMKLQKMLSRKYKDKEYHKYVLVIPKEDVKKAKFKDGEELKSEVKEGEIKIIKK